MTDQAPLPLRRFETFDALTATLARVIAERLTDAVGQRGRASLVASGGSTPGPLYDRLSLAEAPWPDVEVTVSDERWTPPGAEGSNERMLHERLLVRAAAQATYIGLRTEHATPEAAEAACDQRLRAMARPFDVTLLGMGDDGHTASLFPFAPGLDRALDLTSERLAAAVRPAMAAGSAARMSLSLRALYDSRIIILLLSGEAKLSILQKLVPGSDWREAPVRALFTPSAPPVDVWWAP
jgi:6-phosphogluconolactonase